jgi:phosphoacetylglucosamine mutase
MGDRDGKISLVPEVLIPQTDRAQVLRLLAKYPLPPGNTHYAYGTAGFRFDASLLPPIMVRVGIAACLRSSFQQNQAVGVMVTASHNDESYNGVKLADPDGGMMGVAGEELAVELVNFAANSNDDNDSKDNELLWKRVVELQQMYTTSSSSSEGAGRALAHATPVVHIGRDTRSHSPALACLVVKTARAMGCTIIDHGVVTTPILHYAVQHANAAAGCGTVPLQIPVRVNTAGYQDLLAHSYLTLLGTASTPVSNTSQQQQLCKQKVLLVDCACGVGYPHLQSLLAKIDTLSHTRSNNQNNNHTKIVATNAPHTGPLNEKCGSEHVQKSLQPPTWYEEDVQAVQVSKTYCASLDGDSDRIVFFSVADNDIDPVKQQPLLLDGDKIACLICHFLQKQLSDLQTACPELANATLPELRLGVVQTAYANGASTAYLQKILSPANICITKTGVKYVHAAAHREFDIGVYFEANGHGTVLFNDAFYKFMAAADSAMKMKGVSAIASPAAMALQRLKVLPSLVNQAVGDALSDLLLVDAILHIQQWTAQDWNSMYTDLPSRQSVVKVHDRSKILTNENETICLAPTGVQTALDQACRELQGRAFIRPSGTEDVVRIYAEAVTREAADELASRAAAIVHRLCGGVGVLPNSRM